MNRLSSVIAGAITTAISGATLAAAAVSQGVFAGSPSQSPHVGDAANAMAAQQTSWAPDPTVAAPAEATQLAPRVVYVEREPIVVTREIRTVAQTAGNEAPPPPASTATPEPPKATAKPAEAPPPAMAQQPATPPQAPVSPQQKPSAPSMAAATASPAPNTPPAATPGSSGETRTREPEHEREHEREHE